MAGIGTDRDKQRRESQDYARRILLVVAGLTPQVVTETLYALTRGALREGKPPFTPTELWIATTSAGRREVERSLMEVGDNQVGRLCKDYGLAVPAFGDAHLLSLTDERGKPLEDAHDDAAFLALGDMLTARLAEWTDDPECAVHLSLAGGRKTMGYLAGHALSLLGRPQDRLSHVLVNSPFDRIPEFFYPPPTSRTRAARYDDGTEELVDLSRAEVKLAYVPFLRMREVLSKVLREQAKTLPFSDIVESAQRSLDDPVVTIDTHQLLMTCGGVPVKLPEKIFALFYALAKRREAGITPLAEEDEGIECYLTCWEHVLPGGKESGRPLARIEQKEKSWFPESQVSGGVLPIKAEKDEIKRKEKLNNRARDFYEMASRCNSMLKSALGEHLALRYRIISAGRIGETQYLLPEDLVVEFIDESNRREDRE